MSFNLSTPFDFSVILCKKLHTLTVKWPKRHSGHDSTAGTTATIVVILENRFFVAHVGDSSVVVGYKELNSHITCNKITEVFKFNFFARNILILSSSLLQFCAW